MRKFLNQIPRGKVTTYGILARKVGTSPRAMGAMLSCNNASKAPCYKVVKSDGSLGGYSGGNGIKRKVELLRKDGIRIAGGRIDLSKHLHKF